MFRKTTPLVVLVASLYVPVLTIGASGPTQQTEDFSFDLFSGTTLQDAASSKPADQLDYTTGGGVPYPNPYEAQRVGETGPLLLQDFHLIESLAHFHRERVPERVVHAKGAGAHGYFQTTTDVGKNYSMADVFQRVGEKTPITARFSTVGGEQGSADVVRDPRGFSVKLRTKKGVWDWVFNNTPVFFIRDPAKFPLFIHTQKRNPQTHLKDKDMFWDYLSSNPESLYQVMRLFSDSGTPYGFRFMNGWSGHTFRLVRADGSWNYVKFSAYTDQGVRNHTNEEATLLAGSNPDFGTEDLFEAIEAKNYPSWTVYIQALSPKDAETFKYNVFDLTKDWSDEDVPRQEIGRFVLTQNPENYFAEIEQAAFAPGHLVEGIEPSEDPVLQARLFAYPDAQRYRLGVNYQSIPVNCPVSSPTSSVTEDSCTTPIKGDVPNYPSSQDVLNLPTRAYNDANHTIWVGGALRYMSTMSPIDYDWPQIYWRSLSKLDQDHLIDNVVGHLGGANSTVIKQRQAALFAKVDPSLGARIAAGINVTLV